MTETKLLLWGKNDDGQLGSYQPSHGYGTPSPAVKPRGFTSIADNGHGASSNQTQLPQISASFRPALVASPGMSRHVRRHSMGSRDIFSHLPVTCEVLTGIRVLQVSCGSRHTLAVVEGGDAYSWGWGACGQLGHGDEESAGTPRLIERLKNGQDEGVEPPGPVTYVSAGGIHSAAIVESGRVYTWGYSRYGQLGLGPEVTAKGSQTYPGKVMLSKTESPRGTPLSSGCAGLTRRSTKYQEEMVLAMHTAPKVELLAKMVACGGMHTAALTEEGMVFCWGRADSGQLGIGSEWIHETTSGVIGVEWPRRVGGHLESRRTASISCGGFHTAALTTEGECYTWGKEDYGMLGCSNEALLKGGLFLPRPVSLRYPQCNSPFDEEGGSGSMQQKAVAVACGGWHTAVIGENGGVWMCGRGEFGRLGLGDQKSQWLLTPVSLDGKHPMTEASKAKERRDSIALLKGDRGVTPIKGDEDQEVSSSQEGNGNDWEAAPEPPSPQSPVSCLSVKEMEIDGAVRTQDPATMVALGGSHSLVATASSRVFTFGRQSYGRLGMDVKLDGVDPGAVWPVEPDSLQPPEGWAVQSISAGGTHNAMILERKQNSNGVDV